MSIISLRAAERAPGWLRLLVFVLSLPIMWPLYFVVLVYGLCREFRIRAFRG